MHACTMMSSICETACGEVCIVRGQAAAAGKANYPWTNEDLDLELNGQSIHGAA